MKRLITQYFYLFIYIFIIILIYYVFLVFIKYFNYSKTIENYMISNWKPSNKILNRMLNWRICRFVINCSVTWNSLLINYYFIFDYLIMKNYNLESLLNVLDWKSFNFKQI